MGRKQGVLISFDSLQNLEQAVLELEKAAPSIRLVLDSIPSLKRLMEAAKIFSSAMEMLPGQSPASALPVAQASSGAPKSVQGEYKQSFTDIIMNTLREQGGKMTPIQVFAICRDRGWIEDTREAKLKVSSTMYYLAKKMKVLGGNGQEGYFIPLTA